jgi:hypothetical protein
LGWERPVTSHVPNAVHVVSFRHRGRHGKARTLLFSVGKSEVIDEACHEAAAAGLGYLSEGHSLQLHSSQINRFRAGYTISGFELKNRPSSQQVKRLS